MNGDSISAPTGSTTPGHTIGGLMIFVRLVLIALLLEFNISPGLALLQSAAANANTWFVGADGWTVFRGTPTGTGTCGNSSSNFTGTCVVYVDSKGGNDSTC